MSDPLTFFQYQMATRDTAIYKSLPGMSFEFLGNAGVHLGACLSESDHDKLGVGANHIYSALGLCGEAGEVAEKIKKSIRDNGGQIDKEAMKKELGDVLWYLASLAYDLDLDLQEIAQDNLDKLRSRKERGVLQGSGDDR